MKLFKQMLLLVVTLMASSYSYAEGELEQDGSPFNTALNERDWRVLKEFLNSKREIDVREKASNLVISGDVRTEWRHMTEKADGTRLRGPGAYNIYTILPGVFPMGLPVSRNDFDIEFNMRFDYVTERAWAVGHLQFDNSAGVADERWDCKWDPEGYHGSGVEDNLNLKRAYWGYNLYNCNDKRLDIEIGRRRLYDVFDSQVQFLSRFDGVLLKYTEKLPCDSDWYWYGAAFVVDERVNHFSYVTEIGINNICNSRFDLSYSFIHWNKYGKNRCDVHNPIGFRSQNSQLTAYYNFDSDWLGKPAYLFGAVLYNHNASHLNWKYVTVRLPVNPLFLPNSFYPQKRSRKEPWAWYVGINIGKVKKEGDWSFNAQYEWVGATAVIDGDVSGIGRGNTWGESITAVGRGNANYHGVKFEALYAITDNLSLDAIIEYSRALKKQIGKSHEYSKFELEAIYAF